MQLSEFQNQLHIFKTLTKKRLKKYASFMIIDRLLKPLGPSEHCRIGAFKEGPLIGLPLCRETLVSHTGDAFFSSLDTVHYNLKNLQQRFEVRRAACSKIWEHFNHMLIFTCMVVVGKPWQVDDLYDCGRETMTGGWFVWLW